MGEKSPFVGKTKIAKTLVYAFGNFFLVRVLLDPYHIPQKRAGYHILRNSHAALAKSLSDFMMRKATSLAFPWCSQIENLLIILGAIIHFCLLKTLQDCLNYAEVALIMQKGVGC